VRTPLFFSFLFFSFLSPRARTHAYSCAIIGPYEHAFASPRLVALRRPLLGEERKRPIRKKKKNKEATASWFVSLAGRTPFSSIRAHATCAIASLPFDRCVFKDGRAHYFLAFPPPLLTDNWKRSKFNSASREKKSAVMNPIQPHMDSSGGGVLNKI
jgi:hypothetical protein